LGEIIGILLESNEKQYLREWWDFRLNPKLFNPIWGWILKWCKSRKLRIEFFSIVLVFGGLVIEFGASHKAYIASDSLTESLRAQTAQANLLSTSNELQVAILTSNNLVLQKELLPRIITTKQMEDFKLYMTFVSKKTPVRISIGPEGFDTETFGKQLRDTLSYAGFTNTPECGVWGLYRDATRCIAIPTGDTNLTIPDAEIIFYSTNEADFTRTNGGEFIMPYNYHKSPFTNFENIPVVLDSDSSKQTFNAIGLGLKQIGLNVPWVPENQWVKSNEFEIFIPIKP
jgi:hypothetical protein